jgi:hypothetical protein
MIALYVLLRACQRVSGRDAGVWKQSWVLNEFDAEQYLLNLLVDFRQ